VTYLSDELYKTITDSVPLPCVDLIPVRGLNDAWQIGTITRGTGSETGKATLIGGRIWHDETVIQAMRHLRTDLDIESFEFLPGNDELRPFRVQQYKHADHAEASYGYDPSKHAIGLTYLIVLANEPKPANEASAFHWVTAEEISTQCGYGQDQVMRAAFDFLADIPFIKI
jgi:hypothetical protein